MVVSRGLLYLWKIKYNIMQKIDRLFFRKSVNRRKEECFIGKVVENGKDVIVIANQNSGIDKVGRWDVEITPISKGSGYVVTSAKFSLDTLGLAVSEDRMEVVVMVNGVENKLKRKGEDGKEKYIRLVWQAGNKTNYNTLLRNLEEKTRYLQLGESFSMSDFLSDLQYRCDLVDDLYRAKRFKDYVPNTPFADFFQNRK